MSLSEQLEALLAAAGSVAQYETHRCHWPDARCVICEAWGALGQERLELARLVIQQERALRDESHGEGKAWCDVGDVLAEGCSGCQAIAESTKLAEQLADKTGAEGVD